LSRNRLLAPFYEPDEYTPPDIEAYELSLTRITPESMQERGRRLRKAFPALWAEHSADVPLSLVVAAMRLGGGNC